MLHKKRPSLIRLMKLYLYNPETGLFIHKRDTGRGRSGELAGFIRKDGYSSISIDGYSWLAHQLAWFYHYARWLPQLDHKNRVRHENWIKNLRPATRAQNNGNSEGWAQDKRKYRLPRGVYHYRNLSRYRAQIVVNYKIIHLGCFDTVEEAQAAYQKAAVAHFGEFAP